MFKFIHGADFHLDSAFGALTAQQSAARRREHGAAAAWSNRARQVVQILSANGLY